MKTQLDNVITTFLSVNEIQPGTIAVPVDVILKKIQDANPQLPVSKSAVGRRLTGIFTKKQQYGTWGSVSGLVQCYYLNKEV